MLGETWEHQYRRMKRSYALVKSDASQKDTALDALYHFCFDVLHLRDWINKSDLIDVAARRDVWALFGDSDRRDTSWGIQACADVAVAAKHFKLSERSTPPAEVVDHDRGTTLPFTLPATLGPAHFVIDVDGTRYSATTIADAALAEWDGWLASHGLAIPE